MELFENLPSLQSTITKKDANGEEKFSVKNKTLSLVDSIGNAGTPVAFVPTSLIQQRQKKLLKKDIEKIDKNIEENCVINNRKPQQHSKFHSVTKDTAVKNDGLFPIDQKNADPDDTSEPYTFALDSEKLSHLHASITLSKIYDPFVPNDYLKYKEQRKSELLRKEYERKALETLKKQQKLRERIAEERKKAELDGGIDKIIESRLGSCVDVDSINRNEMRGRGGASNLPAWLIQKKRDESVRPKQVKKISSSDFMSIENFDDAPLC